jgi:hypothetical protein
MPPPVPDVVDIPERVIDAASVPPESVPPDTLPPL